MLIEMGCFFLGCNCKKNGKGHNFIPERITVTGADGAEITNRDLICHHCVYKKRGDTSSCLKYEKKPESVFEAKFCEGFLSSGEDLTKNHGCKTCESHCDGCDGVCTNCGGCEK